MGNKQQKTIKNKEDVNDLLKKQKTNKLYNDYNENILWLDKNVNNFENSFYQSLIMEKNTFKLSTFTEIKDCISKLKQIKFEKTYILLSGSISKDFFIEFEKIIGEIKINPIIIIFTSEEKLNLIKKNILSLDKFTLFDINLVFDNYNKIVNQIESQNSYKLNYIEPLPYEEDENCFSFEYINELKDLIFPLSFIEFMENPNKNEIKKFNYFLLNKYSEKIKMKILIEQLLVNVKIPIQILVKFWLRAYTLESNFYREMNYSLERKLGNDFDIYIKALYQGLLTKSITPLIEQKLYRGAKINKKELDFIKNSLANKKENLPGCICYNKAFLSSSLDKNIALGFLLKRTINENEEYVLYSFQKGEQLDKENATNADIQEFSIYNEKEILFFPFSTFEIKNIAEIKGKEKLYHIQLLYLGKYLKDLENDKSLSLNENKLPDSKFKTQLKNSGLVEKEKIENVDIKTVNNDFKKYEKEIKENEMKNNFITGEIYINDYDVNQEIPIINSFENVKRINKFKKRKDDWIYENEKELQENVEIRINGKKIKFSYTHKFDKEGKYKIEYFFKNKLTKTNHMFYQCLRLIKLNLLNFNTKNVTNMSYMFYFCNLIPKLDLSGFDTKNVRYMNFMFGGCSSVRSIEISKFNTGKVINMRGIFWNCNSLINLDLSSFITQNVVDMSSMFNGCKLLKNLDLSNFDTKNVINMNSMFDGCEYLTDLNLSNFNTEKVENMSCMFFNCIKLENLDLSKFNTKNVYSMKNMFFCCNSLTNLDLSNFDTNNVNDMNCMFYECNSLVSLNLKNFKTINVNDMNNIFDGCISLNKESIITDDRQILKRLRSTY